jgi:hypothetical protein
MSWSKGFPNKESFGNKEQREEARASVISQSGADAGQQFDAACTAADIVINSGSIGDSAKDFSISLSGHSNPNHEPTPGWANDCVTINIYQTAPAAAPV